MGYKDLIGRCCRGHQVTVIVTSYKKYNGCLQHGYINTSEMNHNHHRNKKRNNMATNDNYNTKLTQASFQLKSILMLW